MRTGFLAPVSIMALKNNPSDFVPVPYRWATNTGVPAAIKAMAKPVTLLYDPHIAPNATDYLKVAGKLGATTVVAPYTPMDNADTYAKVLRFFDLKSLGDLKIIVVPQGKDINDFWGCVNSIVTANIHNSPAFDSFGLDSMTLQAAGDEGPLSAVKVPEAYLYRVSVTSRMTRQANTQNCSITLINGGVRGGREIAEYRFVRNVKTVITPDPWLLADNMIQLGIPTQGCDAASTTDYDLFGYPEVQQKTEPNTTKENIFVSNTMSLSGLAK